MNTTAPKCPTCGSVMRWYAGHSNGVQLYSGGPDTRADYYRCENTELGVAKHHRFFRVTSDGEIAQYQLRAEALEKCPECGTVLEFLQHVPPQALKGGGKQVIIPLASAVFECSTHGRWRIYINGQYEKYGKPRA